MPGWGGEIFRSHIHIPGVKGAYYSEGKREQWHGPRMSADSSLTVDIGTGMSAFSKTFWKLCKKVHGVFAYSSYFCGWQIRTMMATEFVLVISRNTKLDKIFVFVREISLQESYGI
jgi:hypothetical protein